MREICNCEKGVVVVVLDRLGERNETLLHGERVPVEHDLRIPYGQAGPWPISLASALARE